MGSAQGFLQLGVIALVTHSCEVKAYWFALILQNATQIQFPVGEKLSASVGMGSVSTQHREKFATDI